MNYKKIVSFSIGLADYILFVKIPVKAEFSGLCSLKLSNFLGLLHFQPDLDWLSDVKLGILKQKKWEVKAHSL